VERPLIALVGGETLLAREIRELLAEAKPSPRVQLISAAATGPTLVTAEEEDELAVMVPLSAESLDGARLAFLAGSAASSRRTLKMNPQSGPVLIDLAGALEEQPDARLRAPTAELAPPTAHTGVQVIAHPAAIALAMFFTRLAQGARIRQSLVHVFEPASERGKRGLDELHQQTVAVLAFKKLKTDVFDAQLAYNMLARYGEEALEPLEGVEQRLERHLASLLAAWPGVPMPSLRLIQAPVFHGHSFSIWVELEENPGAKELARILADAGLDVRPDDPPTNAGIAGHSGLSVGAIAADSNHPRGMWFWAAADNLRLTAENAIAVAKEFL
jgi:aspartate-semialdehyde dehydrogenase